MIQPEENRPDPDDLLHAIISDENKSRSGKMNIFFGMCAGVGKTYTMLEVALAEKQKGLDIVAGYIETHNRSETDRLASEIETIPKKRLEYRNTVLQEMDLDAVIARKPHTVLVDELAHTNAPGSRHSKRYQDVLELLDNGINVYTTLNVQHLESRSETVAQITGVVVRETVPDEIFENAEEVELVDLPPEELLLRLSEGKVYHPERSKEAIEKFFRKGNITALREMALRIVADRVDKQLHDYMQRNRIQGPWKSGLHLLVAIDHRLQSTRLLRWAKNLSSSMGANIQGIYVETLQKLSDKEKAQLEKNFILAKQLGIKFRIVTDRDVVKAIVNYAKKENISHIIVGKPRIRNFLSMFRLGNVVNRLIRYSGNIDVYILGSDKKAKDYYSKKVSAPSFTSDIKQYLTIAILVAFVSVVCFLIKEFVGYQVVSFILLFLVSILALFFGTGPILMAATLSALIWDYFFLPPYYTMHVDRPEDLLMLTMFFIIALLNGILTSRVREQEKKTRIREEQTFALYQLTKDLSVASGIENVRKIAQKHVQKYFSVNSTIILKNEIYDATLNNSDKEIFNFSDNDRSVIAWVYKHSLKAGRFTNTLPSGIHTYFPLSGINENNGVIAVDLEKPFLQNEEQFWDSFISQISGRIEREFLRNAAKTAMILNESDKLYKTLFNSISHEFRIPVTTILAASDTLMSEEYPHEMKTSLYSEINKASIRLFWLIENLLNMSRLESGHLTIRKDWCDVHDVVNKVIKDLRDELSPFNFDLVISDDIPLMFLDFGIIEQVLHNLLLNATQNAPAGTTIRLKMFCDREILIIQVMDRGHGFVVDDLPMVFNKFFRGKNAKTGGTGLGLSIVKGFIEAHGGNVTAENRKNGGAKFIITIPVEKINPDL